MLRCSMQNALIICLVIYTQGTKRPSARAEKEGGSTMRLYVGSLALVWAGCFWTLGRGALVDILGLVLYAVGIFVIESKPTPKKEGEG